MSICTSQVYTITRSTAVRELDTLFGGTLQQYSSSTVVHLFLAVLGIGEFQRGPCVVPVFLVVVPV